MSSYYHVGCFVLPRKLKHLGTEDFVREKVTDLSEDQSILPAQFDTIVSQIEESAGAAGSAKKKVKREGGDGDDEEEKENLMTRVAAEAKVELDEEEGKQPAKKKAKKETTKISKAEEEEFRDMVELYKEHYKTKVDILKDFLR